MPRHNPIPSYRLHKQSGQAIVTLTDPSGQRRDVLLGVHDTPESRTEYARVIAEWEANGRRLSSRNSGSDQTVSEVILAYFTHCQSYYRHPDGTPTSELDNIRYALKPLKALYGNTLAAAFDSLCLEAVQQHLLRDGYCRNQINKHVSRIKRLFKWAASRRLVPTEVHTNLATIEGLRRGEPLSWKPTRSSRWPKRW